MKVTHKSETDYPENYTGIIIQSSKIKADGISEIEQYKRRFILNGKEVDEDTFYIYHITGCVKLINKAVKEKMNLSGLYDMLGFQNYWLPTPLLKQLKSGNTNIF